VRVDDHPGLRGPAVRPQPAVPRHQSAGARRRRRRGDQLVGRAGRGALTGGLLTERLDVAATARVLTTLDVVDPNPLDLESRRGLILAIKVVELDTQMPGRHVLDVTAPVRAAATRVLEPQLAIQVPTDIPTGAPLVLESEVV